MRLGWPLFVATNIITGNVWGAVTGEWTGAGRRAYTYAYAGIGVLVVAIFVISRGGREIDSLISTVAIRRRMCMLEDIQEITTRAATRCRRENTEESWRRY